MHHVSGGVITGGKKVLIGRWDLPDFKICSLSFALTFSLLVYFLSFKISDLSSTLQKEQNIFSQCYVAMEIVLVPVEPLSVFCGLF